MKYTSNDIRMRLETAVLTACRQSLPLDNLEVDAIICVNVADKKEEHVVKIHQRFDVCESANKTNSRLREVIINDDTHMIIESDIAKFDILSVKDDKLAGIKKEPNMLETDMYGSKENCIDIEGSSKLFRGFGRSPSKHPRKSSTPRCLNPKLRQMNYQSSAGAKKDHYGTNENLSKLESRTSAIRNFYGINELNAGHVNTCKMENMANEIVINDMHNNNQGINESAQPLIDNDLYIKIEPNTIDDNYTEYNQMLPEEETGNSKISEKKSDAGNGCSVEMNLSNEEYTIELNSDSESYDTTYNYTFEKSIDESLEQNTQAVMKSLDDSDDQSLGSSPSDLTNSMISYNVSHIIPLGTINESNEILDIPNYTKSLSAGKGKSVKSKAGGKWNDLASKKCSDIPSAVEKLSCRTCGAMFSSTRTRRRHENSTCGATRYSCLVCSKLFSRKDARRRHMLRMHPANMLENPYTSINFTGTIQAWNTTVFLQN